MSRLTLLGFFVFSPLFLFGCTATKVDDGPKIIGSGKKATFEREHADFDKVELTTFGEMDVTIGEKFSVKVDIDDNLEDIIETKVTNGKLIVTTTKRFSSSLGPIVRIEMPVLKGVDLPGRGSATFRGVKDGELTLKLTGAGSITGAGAVDQINVYHSGGGRVDLRKLEAKRAKVVLSGDGGVSLKAEDFIEIDSSGSGTVAVHSKPTEVKKKISGSGVVEIGEQ